jgi:hypothetical protein
MICFEISPLPPVYQLLGIFKAENTGFSRDSHPFVTWPGHIGGGKNNKADKADKQRSEDEDDKQQLECGG